PHDLRHGEGGRPRHGNRRHRPAGEVRRPLRRLAARELTAVALLPVDDALELLLASASRLGPETVPIGEAAWRVLAGELSALRTQPPFPVSAMDGYAVRAADIATLPAFLEIIGEAPAGRPFGGSI